MDERADRWTNIETGLFRSTPWSFYLKTTLRKMPMKLSKMKIVNL